MRGQPGRADPYPCRPFSLRDLPLADGARDPVQQFQARELRLDPFFGAFALGDLLPQAFVCRAQDAVTFLRDRPAESIGAIFAAQVIEHFPFEMLKEFLALCRSRLRRARGRA